MIVVLDTNVWISALHFDKNRGTPRQAIKLAVERDTIATCDEIEDEIRRILTTKFHWPSERVHADLEAALAGSVRVSLQHTVSVCRDRDDDMFLECAALANADLLIAGDKDLLVLGTFGRTKIVTPAEYLRISLSLR